MATHETDANKPVTKTPPAAAPATTPVITPPVETKPVEPAKTNPPVDPTPRPPAQPTTITKMVKLAAGQAFEVCLQTPVSTASEKAGQPFMATIEKPVQAEGAVVIPVGSSVKGQVTFAKRAGSVGGKARMTLEFNELTTPDGMTRRIYSEPLTLEGEGTGSGDAQKVIGGAVGGAIIGGILGGKDGALKGAAGGAAAGGVWAVATKGNDIVLEPDQKIMVTPLRAIDFTVTVPNPAL